MKAKTPVRIKKLMRELKEGLVRIYGDQLKAVYLYGSYARGDYHAGSDVDVMILLSGYKNYWDELKRTSELIQNVSLNHNLTVSRIFMTQEKWLRSDIPLLKNIHHEGQLA